MHSAREFVWWYNGHPDAANLQVDLKSTDTVVILGQVCMYPTSTLLKCKKMTLAIGVCMTTLHMVIGSNDTSHTLVATHRM